MKHPGQRPAEASTFLRRHRTCAVIRPTFAVIQLADARQSSGPMGSLVAFANGRAAGRMVATSKLFASSIVTVCVSKVSIRLPYRPIVLVTFIICPCDFESSIIQDHRPLPRPDPATTADHTRNVATNNTLTRSDFGAAEPDRNLRKIAHGDNLPG
jgi:hypothetical protein